MYRVSWIGKWVGIVLAATFYFSAAWPSTPEARQELSDRQRSELRFRIENLFNEVDLLIKNERADRSDLARQEREAKALKVYDRIPFEADLPGLKRQLAETASAQG